MKMCMKYTFALAIVGVLVTGTQSFSTGAGGCKGGVAAVEGLHLSRAATTTGSLELGGVTLSSNGVAVANGGAVTANVNTAVTLSVDVAGTTTRQFKGILYRLERQSGTASTTGFLTPANSDTQAAGACSQPIVGVTHSSSALKSRAQAVLNVKEVASFFLDITVVFANVASTSEYYFTRFSVNIVSAPVAPVAAPGAPVAPVAAPSAPAAPAAPATPSAPAVPSAPAAPAAPSAPVVPKVPTAPDAGMMSMKGGKGGMKGPMAPMSGGMKGPMAPMAAGMGPMAPMSGGMKGPMAPKTGGMMMFV
jgi:hypothetical protein